MLQNIQVNYSEPSVSLFNSIYVCKACIHTFFKNKQITVSEKIPCQRREVISLNKIKTLLVYYSCNQSVMQISYTKYTFSRLEV